jgi:hypothetical protein
MVTCTSLLLQDHDVDVDDNADGASLILGLRVIKSESDADDEDFCSVSTWSPSPGIPLGGGVNGCTDEAKTDDQDEDDKGMSYVIPAKLCAIFYFHYETSSSCHQDHSQERSTGANSIGYEAQILENASSTRSKKLAVLVPAR